MNQTPKRYRVDAEALIQEGREILSLVARGLVRHSRIEYIEGIVEFDPYPDWRWTLRSRRIVEEIEEVFRECYGLIVVFMEGDKKIDVPVGRVEED